MWVACWTKGHSDELTQADGKDPLSLETLLDRLHAENADLPLMVDVTIQPEGDTLSIGLGREYSVLSYINAANEPPYYVSRASSALRRRVFSFLYGGQLSEFAARSAISIEDAREVMREFLETGQLSNRIRWEEV